MSMKIVKIIGNVIKFIWAGVGTILCLLILFKGVDGDNVVYVDMALGLARNAVIITAIVAIIFGIVYFATNIKKGLGAVIGLVALLLVFGIGYGMANGALSEGWAAEGVTENISRLAGMGIWVFLILTVVAIVAAVASEVIKLVK